MSASQPLVAAEILDAVDLSPFRSLLDVGGGEGRFLTSVAARAHTHTLNRGRVPRAFPADASLPVGAADAAGCLVALHTPEHAGASLLAAAERAMPVGVSVGVAERPVSAELPPPPPLRRSSTLRSDRRGKRAAARSAIADEPPVVVAAESGFGAPAQTPTGGVASAHALAHGGNPLSLRMAAMEEQLAAQVRERSSVGCDRSVRAPVCVHVPEGGCDFVSECACA
jgi:hypothetical protein